jgi:hypothetical protein
MYLEASPTGGKYWRFKYRFGGTEKRLALGIYPAVRLAAARKKRDAAREQLAAGLDPGELKKLEKRNTRLKADSSFEAVARDWLEERKTVVQMSQHEKTLARLENDVFPWIGKRPITEIDAPDILAVVNRIDSRGARYPAHRVRSEISRVFRYAIKEGKAKTDPARDLIGAIPPPVEKHFAAITEPTKVGEMLRAFDGFSGHFPFSARSSLRRCCSCAPASFAGRVGTVRSRQGRMALLGYENKDRASRTAGGPGSGDLAGTASD